MPRCGGHVQADVELHVTMCTWCSTKSPKKKYRWGTLGITLQSNPCGSLGDLTFEQKHVETENEGSAVPTHRMKASIQTAAALAKHVQYNCRNNDNAYYGRAVASFDAPTKCGMNRTFANLSGRDRFEHCELARGMHAHTHIATGR